MFGPLSISTNGPNLEAHVGGEPEYDRVVDDVERAVEGAERQPRRPLQPRLAGLQDAARAAGQRAWGPGSAPLGGNSIDI